jgi:hypothetical protein
MILFVPISINFGMAALSISLLLIVKTTENSSFVTPGAPAVSELSLKLKLQVTAAVFFPLSLGTSILDGQVNTGDS